MAKFNPNMLIPAAQVHGAAKGTPVRTIQQIALDNIDRMRGEYKDHQAGTTTEGRKNWRVVGDRVAFAIRVSNTALVLAEVEVPGSTEKLAVKEMTVPAANVDEALAYYADRVKAGEFTGQLEALTGRKDARATKRAENKAAKAESATVDKMVGPQGEKKPS